MKIRLGVVMDPIAAVNYAKDTTLAMLWAAEEHGCELWYMEQSDLQLVNANPLARMRPLKVFHNPEAWHQLGEARVEPLESLDVILMRKDPPFDNEYIYSTYILEVAQQRGCVVVNDPRSLRDCNEKLYATRFPQCCPPLLVSRDPELLKTFYRQHGDVVFKPLDSMGGAMVFRVCEGDPNLSVILETLTRGGLATIMAQRYIPEIRDGDKRILLINGDPVPYCLARVPAVGETRGNLAAGGTGRAQALTERDRWICAQVSEDLKARGLLFVGLDVIGDYLTEINVTSPTCVREIDKAFDTNIGGKLMSMIETRLSSR